MGKKHRHCRNDVLRFVKGYIEANGYPPSYNEIAASVGLSSRSHADYYLDALEEEGLVQRKPRTPRALRLAGSSPDTITVRIEGTIAAGQPIGLAQGLAGEIQLTQDIVDPRRQLFALAVQGDSMVDDMVGDGDILIVERKQEACQGQMAVVYLRDRNEATLKRLYLEGERVRLQPAHPTLPPIYADAKNVEVQGRVVAIIRQL